MSNMIEGIVPNHAGRRRTVPELLCTRQQHGINARIRNHRVTVTELSSRVAWNANRMQNMTLCVGPGTPATVCMLKTSTESSTSSEEEKEENEAESEDQETDHTGDRESVRDEGDDEDSNDEMNHEGEGENISIRRTEWMRRRQEEQEVQISRAIEATEQANALLDWMDCEDVESEDGDEDVIDTTSSGRFTHFIRHGGCINTATWLTSPWRLSLAGRGCSDEASTVHSEECPTQLITSGDDRQVKFWDVRHAIGTSNPLPGGKNTVCPFSSDVPDGPPTDKWKDSFAKSVNPVSGSIIPLASLDTRHRGNVFHVTPVDSDPGKVVTCGADGFLRCADLSTGSSSVVISPEFDRERHDLFLSPGGLLSLRPGMCFSHHFVDENTGLLCSERGLRRFDLRVNPREQHAGSVLSSETCKACAIWSRDSTDSAYVFAGGASAEVGLFDLRMVSDSEQSRSKVVQVYRPRGLSEDASVSVSGIDISRSKRELLVSYENDQIYSFPICPHVGGPAGPTVDELSALMKEREDTKEVQSELCAYGGHLNRYTFLKNAKYAGPNDELICTGSDSGHAWIYDKQTGSVVSFLNADHSTCNGVVPHPSLPLFVTYGIDSTAKLWRATTPVDVEVDDSPIGRWKFFHQDTKYVPSPVVTNWPYCREKLSVLSDMDEGTPMITPDEVPASSSLSERGIFGGFFRSRRFGGSGGAASYIGNDLQNLPETLRQNLFSCVVAHSDDDDEPVRSSISELKRRISTIRLQHQANQRGLRLNPSVPWLLVPRKGSSDDSMCDDEDGGEFEFGAAVDLVPESPGDWIPYDPEMTSKPAECGLNFNITDYDDFFFENYGVMSFLGSAFPPGAHTVPTSTPNHIKRNKRKLDIADTEESKKLETESVELVTIQGAIADSCLENRTVAEPATPSTLVSSPSLSSSEEEGAKSNVSTRALQLLHDTAMLLKNSGNVALKVGLPALAARRYDHALRYLAVAFLRFPGKDDLLISQGSSRDPTLEWSTLVKLLVTTRLNLSLACLKLADPEPKRAADLAMISLVDLSPFVIEKGKIRKGKKFAEVHKEDEPESTFVAAKELQAKAFFRLGCAQYEIGDYSDAVKSFEHSIKSTKAINEHRKPESAVLRRLAEAKRECLRKKKKQKRTLKAIFGEGGNEGKNANAKLGEESDGVERLRDEGDSSDSD